MVRTGRGVGARSGWLGFTYAEGSRMCPMRPLARIRACTPSSQRKKSLFELRTVIWVTVGKVLEEEIIVVGREEGGKGRC